MKKSFNLFIVPQKIKFFFDSFCFFNIPPNSQIKKKRCIYCQSLRGKRYLEYYQVPYRNNQISVCRKNVQKIPRFASDSLIRTNFYPLIPLKNRMCVFDVFGKKNSFTIKIPSFTKNSVNFAKYLKKASFLQ